MKTITVVPAASVAVLAVLLSGCVATGASGAQYRIGLDGIHEIPQEQEQVASAQVVSASSVKNTVSGFDITSSHDVDTAYLRIKREFGFLDNDERPRPQYEGGFNSRGRYETRLVDAIYHQTRMHRAEPGVRYQMREMLYLGDSRGLVRIDLEKDGPRSRVIVSYQIGGEAGFERDEKYVRAAIEDRLTRALN